MLQTSKLFAFTALLPLTLAIAAGSTAPQPMAPTDVQAATTTLVYGLLSDSRYAYRPRVLYDELSAEIYRRYIE
jgi:carboxyl-terminal processing protease